MRYEYGHTFVKGQIIRIGRKLFKVRWVFGPFYSLRKYAFNECYRQNTIHSDEEPAFPYQMTAEKLIRLGIVTRA